MNNRKKMKLKHVRGQMKYRELTRFFPILWDCNIGLDFSFFHFCRYEMWTSRFRGKLHFVMVKMVWTVTRKDKRSWLYSYRFQFVVVGHDDRIQNETITVEMIVARVLNMRKYQKRKYKKRNGRERKHQPEITSHEFSKDNKKIHKKW